MNGILCAAGAHDSEQDHDGEFRWLGNLVKIQVAGLERVLIVSV